ncbi:MAG: ABC transporter ATP-binding protein [Gemmatimonadales bacterium]|nr:ABC transporter ATP-binding protein [Gemmatimonadales bacterium]
MLERARGDLRERPLTLLESLGHLLQSGITLVAISVMLLRYGPWLPLLLLISTIPVLLVVVRHNLRFHEWWKQSTIDRRWTQYYDTLLTLDGAAAEVRLFDLGPHIHHRYDTLRRRLRADYLRLTGRQSLARLGAGTGSLLVTGGAMGWMVWRALQGQVTLGDIALLYQALNKGQSLMSALLENLGRIFSTTVFLGNLFEFLALKPTILGPPRPIPAPVRLREGITFRRVSFRYPGSDHPILESFDFHIPAGKIVAIVGPNGAGKTTLMKLLCRFYDPESGSIEFDGIDLRSLAVPDLRRMMTGLFQFPVPYLATVTENITMGDLSDAHSTSEVEAAARSAGAHDFITRLPQAYATLLGKWFPGGVQLSGGEWQRLALARSFLREAPIIILDEPTSYLDSWAEIDWFSRFRELANGRTAVLITHRFATARYADIIHVMDGGRIVESGTHQDLVNQGGRYADSWLRQTRETSTATT